MVEFLSNNSTFVVLLISLVVWLGLFAYLYRMDRNVHRLEKEIEGRKGELLS